MQQKTLIGHLIELRQRFIYIFAALIFGFCISYFFSQEIFDILVRPLAILLKDQTGRKLIYTHLTEAFTTHLKLSFFCSALITSPFTLAQIWLFVAPGLYAHEKKVFCSFLIASPVLFLLGAMLAYFVIIPFAWQFFLSFETSFATQSLPILLEAKMNEYLSLTTTLILVFGFFFQLPILLILLITIGALSSQKLKQQRKYAFLGILILAAIITPPDILSPIGLTIPVYLLYEVAIFFGRLIEEKKQHRKTLAAPSA